MKLIYLILKCYFHSLPLGEVLSVVRWSEELKKDYKYTIV